MSPLRVAVTRDEPEDGMLTRALREHGLDPVHCPVVAQAPASDPQPLARAAAMLEHYHWLVVASVRAVDALVAARGEGPIPAAVRTAAVGRKTAARLRFHGAAEPLLPEHAGAQSLIEALQHADSWPGRIVLLPRAAEGGREIAESLQGFGAIVDEVIAYRTSAGAPGEIAARWRAVAPEAAVVASPSAARSLVAAVGAPALRALELVAIGPTTAAALAELGLTARLPRSPDFECAALLLSEIAAARKERVV
jgi:uroporphyrinogen-III synthase